MNILYVTTISNTINAFLIPHIKLLTEQGHKVSIACNIVQDIDSDLLNLICKIHYVPFQRNPIKRENMIAYKTIKKVVNDGGYTIIHVHTPVASFLTRLACRNLSFVRILYTAHGFHFFKGAPLKNWIIYHTIERIVAKWTDVLITMNDEDYQYATKFKSRRLSTYKVNGVGLDLSKFSPPCHGEKDRLRRNYGFNREDFILIYVGELSYRKHQDLLIKAVFLLRKKIENIKLLLVGDGDLSTEYKLLVQKLNLQDCVKFLGFRRDIPNLMKLSDIAISTSRQEGLPVNLMEAMATGLPIVATNCRGNRDLVRDGINGFIISIHDVEECVRAVDKIYSFEELRKEFGDFNQDLVSSYSIEKVKDEMNTIYLEIFTDIQQNTRYIAKKN